MAYSLEDDAACSDTASSPVEAAAPFAADRCDAAEAESAVTRSGSCCAALDPPQLTIVATLVLAALALVILAQSVPLMALKAPRGDDFRRAEAVAWRL